MKILIAGDFFINKNSNFYIDKLHDKISIHDYFLFNLEAPLTNNDISKPILKGGPNLSMDLNSLSPFSNYYKKMILSGANNHIGDFGEEGVLSTLKFYRENSILNIGLGKNIEEASKPLFLSNKIVLFAIAENEFGMAEENKAGANPLKIEENLIKIMNLSREGYTVIVYFHGGTETSPIPNPFIKRLFKSFIDAGAKIVIGNHTHSPQGYEPYHNGYIFYSLGNFIFDKREIQYNLKTKIKQKLRRLIKGKIVETKDFWNIGYLISLNIEDNNIDFEVIPITYSNKSIVIMEGNQKENFFKYLKNISEITDNEYSILWNSWTGLKSNFVQNRISDFSYRNINSQYNSFLSFRNIITCESHRELLINLNFLIENNQLKEYLDSSKIKFLQNPDNFYI